jgi:hypothetical protein
MTAARGARPECILPRRDMKSFERPPPTELMRLHLTQPGYFGVTLDEVTINGADSCDGKERVYVCVTAVSHGSVAQRSLPSLAAGAFLHSVAGHVVGHAPTEKLIAMLTQQRPIELCFATRMKAVDLAVAEAREHEEWHWFKELQQEQEEQQPVRQDAAAAAAAAAVPEVRRQGQPQPKRPQEELTLAQAQVKEAREVAERCMADELTTVRAELEAKTDSEAALIIQLGRRRQKLATAQFAGAAAQLKFARVDQLVKRLERAAGGASICEIAEAFEQGRLRPTK